MCSRGKKSDRGFSATKKPFNRTNGLEADEKCPETVKLICKKGKHMFVFSLFIMLATALLLKI